MRFCDVSKRLVSFPDLMLEAVRDSDLLPQTKQISKLIRLHSGKLAKKIKVIENVQISQSVKGWKISM